MKSNQSYQLHIAVWIVQIEQLHHGRCKMRTSVLSEKNWEKTLATEHKVPKSETKQYSYLPAETVTYMLNCGMTFRDNEVTSV